MKTKAKDDLATKFRKALRAFANGKKNYARGRNLLKEIALEVEPEQLVKLSEHEGVVLKDRFANAEKVVKPTVIDRWELKVVSL